MLNEDLLYVSADTIQNAWREVMWLCVKKGKDFLVKGGSYEGQIRKQLEHVTLVIDKPSTRPLAPIMPPGIPGPTSEEKILDYCINYIIGSEKRENEVYTYGEFISSQLGTVMDLLIKSKGNTNQATICIGNAETTKLKDPPCLRHISFKVVEGKLNMCVYFRSWDLYAGLPENLGGLQLLKENVIGYLKDAGLPVSDGKIIAFSDGLHIYDQYFDIVDMLNIDKIKVGALALSDKAAYIAEHGN